MSVPVLPLVLGGASSPASLPPQSGKLQIFELASGSLLETVDAHDGAVWSLCLAPDQVTPPPPPR